MYTLPTLLDNKPEDAAAEAAAAAAEAATIAELEEMERVAGMRGASIARSTGTDGMEVTDGTEGADGTDGDGTEEKENGFRGLSAVVGTEVLGRARVQLNPAHVWTTRLLSLFLAVSAFYALARGIGEAFPAWREGRQIRKALAEANAKPTVAQPVNGATHSPEEVRAAEDAIAGAKVWSAAQTKRAAGLRGQLQAGCGFLALCPVSLLGFYAVRRRGRRPRPPKKMRVDRLQFVTVASVVIAAGSVWATDYESEQVLRQAPASVSLALFQDQFRAERRAQRAVVWRDQVKQAVERLRDKSLGQPEYAAAAREIGALVVDSRFADVSTPDRRAIHATINELIREHFTSDAVCPTLIKALEPFSGAQVAAAVKAERERSRSTWMDVKGAVPFLFEAAAQGREQDVRTLIKRGADVNAIHPQAGHTALHAAVGKRQLAVAKILLGSGAKVSVAGRYPDPKGEVEFPLHRAAGDVQLVRLLLEKGADPNARDGQGMTPLHHAAWRGDNPSAVLLIKHKANPNHLDRHGRTPLDVAHKLCTVEWKPVVIETLTRNGCVSASKLPKRNSAEAAVPRH